MGQEIHSAEFAAADFERFARNLASETEHLRGLFSSGDFAAGHEVGGFELEAWLVDEQTRPAPVNDRFLASLAHPMVVHELSRFNVEFNSTPLPLHGDALSAMAGELDELWRHSSITAASMQTRLAMTGILPVVRQDELTLANMSAVQRYRALNEQVLRLRHGRPIRLSIQGREQIDTLHHDVMLEAAATSFQVHIQVPPALAVRYFNASLIVSAPIVAASANSPFLFGRELWEETRIPLFEQAVNTDERGAVGRTGRSRVTFGHSFLGDSLMELFEENLALYPVLLPEVCDQAPRQLCHLRLHNGTIWRWNRPLIGVDEQGQHLRIEHRVIPAGPTIQDMIANAALYYGLARALAHRPVPPERELDFPTARANFYHAAEKGLAAEIHWPRELLLHELIPLAGEGLAALGIASADSDRLMAIIRARVESGQTGSAWQRRYRATHGCDLHELTEAYLVRQQSGRPVHEWTL